MKCSNCGRKIKKCDGCNRDFEIDDDIICDDWKGDHFCSISCSDLEEAEVEEDEDN